MPPPDAPVLLTLNAGSSSLKFSAFTPSLERTLSGQIERLASADHGRAAAHCLDALLPRVGSVPLTAIAHRVVHGGLHLLEHQRITDAVVEELRRSQSFDLAHLPREIALIDACRQRFPAIPQVACFDTAFHRDLPRVAQLLPIPRKHLDAGVRRFGFHGLSYTYLLEQLRTIDPAAAEGRVIFAHLGSGASMAAVHRGRPVDTTMAFTPTAGLVMGTRPGDIDPGLLVYLQRAEGLSPDALDEYISSCCGLLGVSETSADVRDLTARAGQDVRAREALDLFCYQAAKFIGALAAAMNGLDTIVFSGGIGEHAAEVRQQICGKLRFLGVSLDAAKNAAHAPLISSEESAVQIRIIATDEERIMARISYELLNVPSTQRVDNA